MSQIFSMQTDDPEGRLIRHAIAIIKRGGLVVYPTDSGYALGCQLGDQNALNRIIALRKLNKDHHMTLVCASLVGVEKYAKVDDSTMRLLRNNTPGAYTFLLKATSEIPRLLLSPERKTIGIRIPDHATALALLEALEEPLMSTTLILPGAEAPLIEPAAIKDLLGQRVDLVIDGGHCGLEPTTIVDLVDGLPKVVRKGKGDPTPFA